MRWMFIVFDIINSIASIFFSVPVKSVPEITEPLKKKLEARVAAAESKFSEWKAKWEKYHEEYVGVYKQIMTERHKWYIDYVTAHYVCL